jgi:hypothetical protein
MYSLRSGEFPANFFGQFVAFQRIPSPPKGSYRSPLRRHAFLFPNPCSFIVFLMHLYLFRRTSLWFLCFSLSPAKAAALLDKGLALPPLDLTRAPSHRSRPGREPLPRASCSFEQNR